MLTTLSRFRAPMAELDMPWIPSVDVTEDGDQLLVSLEVPGVKPEDVKITMENNVMTVRGEKKQQVFERAFTVPNTVDAERISARYEHGVLTVVLPKAEKAKPRQITVQVQA